MSEAPPTDELAFDGADDADDAEDNEDALLEGDRGFTPGTARAAWSHRTFRIVYLGAFASNIGTWMQNVVLGAIAYDLTKSGVFVGLIIFAQLGPLLLLSIVGGMLADTVDRKKLLMILTVEQAFFSAVLAFVVIGDSPSKVLLFGVTLLIGIGNALYAPVFSAVLPILVPRRDMPGAISLNSAQMNGSRVVGPVIGAFLYAHYGPSWVFALNALSYAAVIVSLTRVTLPKPPASGTQGFHRLLEGVQVARADRVVRKCLVTIFVFSLFCLPFITQMPKIAGDNLDIAPKSTAYGLLYACFGLGAVIGALSIGTVFAKTSKPMLTRIGLVGFAAFLTTFGILRVSGPGLPGHLRSGPRLLRGRDVADHRVATGPRRSRPWQGHGAVDHGVRRHGPVRRTGGRLADPARGDHAGPDRRRGRVPRPGLVRRSAPPGQDRRPPLVLDAIAGPRRGYCVEFGSLSAANSRAASRSSPTTRLAFTRTASPSSSAPSRSTAASIESTASGPSISYAGSAMAMTRMPCRAAWWAIAACSAAPVGPNSAIVPSTAIRRCAGNAASASTAAAIDAGFAL